MRMSLNAAWLVAGIGCLQGWICFLRMELHPAISLMEQGLIAFGCSRFQMVADSS